MATWPSSLERTFQMETAMPKPPARRRFDCRPAARAAALALLVAVVPATNAAAQVAVGGEMQVNSYTTSIQDLPAVAIAPDGSFVVVWSSFRGADDDDFNAVNGRRFSAAGVALGADFQVNTYTTESQSQAAVAMGPDGSFVVVWENYESSGAYPVDDVVNIRARPYDSNGNPGGEILVNAPPDEAVHAPDVAMDPNGNFVVVWDGGYANSDGDGYAIHGQRFAAGGTAVGGNFQVNTYTTASQTYPAVSLGEDGSFVVVWNSQAGDGNNYSVRGRRFGANGNALGADFQVNTLTTGFQGDADVAVDPSGTFTVVWTGFETAGNDSYPFSVQGRRFASSGNAIGSDFQVNTYTTSGQGSASIAATSLGTFVVWDSDGSAGTDSTLQGQRSIQRRAFGATGQARSDDVQVNTFTPSFQSAPAVAMNERGDVVVVWESLGSAGTDGDSWSIQSQRFLLPIFSDGFESGDVTAWSSSSP
jgi:hypothetical protein